MSTKKRHTAHRPSTPEELAKIKAIREDYTQAEYAELLGIGRTYLTDLERGAVPLTLAIAERYAVVEGVKASEILRRVGR